MALPLLLLALAVCGTGAWISRRWRGVGQVVMALGGLGLIGVTVLQIRQTILPPQPKVNRCNMAVSYCLANCVLDESHNRSGEVVLLFPQRRIMDEETEQSYEDGFVAPLRHCQCQLNLKAVHIEGPNDDLSAFQQALAQDQEALAVVSYAGAPAGCEALFPVSSNAPAFFVFDEAGTTHWQGPLKSGRIKAVVVLRPGNDPRSRERVVGRPEQIFDQFYILATSANVDDVAASLKSQRP